MSVTLHSDLLLGLTRANNLQLVKPVTIPSYRVSAITRKSYFSIKSKYSENTFPWYLTIVF